MSTSDPETPTICQHKQQMNGVKKGRFLGEAKPWGVKAKKSVGSWNGKGMIVSSEGERTGKSSLQEDM